MECASCSAEVEDETIKCPNCGYYPQKRIVATGMAYMVLGFSLQFFPFGVVLFFPSLGFVSFLSLIPDNVVMGLFFLPIFLGIFVAVYGVSLAFQERTATVNTDIDQYVLPIFL